MPATIYSMSPLTLTKSGGSATTMPVESAGFSPDIMANAYRHSGGVYPTIMTIPGADSRITLTLPAKAAFDLFGLEPIKLTALSLVFAKFADALRASGSVHASVSLTATTGFAAAQITGFSVNLDGVATATVTIVPLTTAGGTNPLTFGTTSAIPTLSGQPLLHTQGPVELGGSVVPGCQGFSVSLGSDLAGQRSDGDLYPTVARRLRGEPRISVRHRDPIGVLSALGLMGSSISSNCNAYFKSYDATTSLAAAANSMKFAMAAGLAMPAAVDAATGEVASGGIDIIPLSSDGVTSPLTVTTNATAP